MTREHASEAPFDPNAAATGSGIYGLPHRYDNSKVILMPVPWEVTVSSGGGTSRGPEAILEGSMQVDLYSKEFGRPYEQGIYLLKPSARLVALHDDAKRRAAPIIARGGDVNGSKKLARDLERVNAACAQMNELVYNRTRRLLHDDKIVGVIGGDHSVPFGAIRAHAEASPNGISVLHVDAHADLRKAYEGFTYSHASIMRNVLNEVPDVHRIVQVGIRDYGEDEDKIMSRRGPGRRRVVTFFDSDLARSTQNWVATCTRIVRELPCHAPVYVSFDIDGLDPSLCPGTGTPVPGGLSFNQATILLSVLATERRIVGFDLNEVAPYEGDRGWNGNVGARLLYHLIGQTLRSATS